MSQTFKLVSLDTQCCILIQLVRPCLCSVLILVGILTPRPAMYRRDRD